MQTHRGRCPPSKVVPAMLLAARRGGERCRPCRIAGRWSRGPGALHQRHPLPGRHGGPGAAARHRHRQPITLPACLPACLPARPPSPRASSSVQRISHEGRMLHASPPGPTGVTLGAQSTAAAGRLPPLNHWRREHAHTHTHHHTHIPKHTHTLQSGESTQGKQRGRAPGGRRRLRHTQHSQHQNTSCRGPPHGGGSLEPVPPILNLAVREVLQPAAHTPACNALLLALPERLLPPIPASRCCVAVSLRNARPRCQLPLWLPRGGRAAAIQRPSRQPVSDAPPNRPAVQ